MAHQMHQQRKHLQFQPDTLAAAEKFEPFRIKAKIAESPCHVLE